MLFTFKLFIGVTKLPKQAVDSFIAELLISTLIDIKDEKNPLEQHFFPNL